MNNIPQYTGQSAINQDAADGGYWHQRMLISALTHWRRNPLGARLALGLFGMEALSAQAIGAEGMSDPSAKPDLTAWMVLNGQRVERNISAKLARIGSTDSDARPMHHAARVKFDDAGAHGLLPDDDFELRGALLAHFIDGESLSRQDPVVAQRALAWLRVKWPMVARSAIEGMEFPKADTLVISLAKAQEDGSLSLVETRLLSAEWAISELISLQPNMSEPREGQVGTIGSKMMHIQRGQALSVGYQRDIQIKINAGALFSAANPLASLPGFSV